MDINLGLIVLFFLYLTQIIIHVCNFGKNGWERQVYVRLFIIRGYLWFYHIFFPYISVLNDSGHTGYVDSDQTFPKEYDLGMNLNCFVPSDLI